MVQVTVEYMILVPVLILILFLFPIATNSIMQPWVDSRRTLALQEAASHLGSTIQQVYYSLNHSSIQAGTLTSALDLPIYIEGYWYNGSASMRTLMDPDIDSSQVLDISLRIVYLGLSANSTVTLGQNVEWHSSYFLSNSTEGVHASCLTAVKLSDGTIRLNFGMT